MKYVLTIDRMDYFPNVDLEKEDYESIKKAMHALNIGLSIEEKYDILISNYSEFEMEILRQATQLMICLPLSYDDFFESRIGFDRKLVNLLTAARLYMYGLSTHVNKIVEGIAKDDIDALRSEQYDSSMEYRFMEALRNHVQHYGLPVHNVQYNPSTQGFDKERKLIYSMELSSKKIFLREDDDFKEKVLKEIPEVIDLKLFTRIYIERISKVHSAIREIVSNTLQESRSLIEKTINSYQKLYPDKILGLYLLCIEGEEEIEKTLLMLDWDNVGLKLIRRNPELIDLRIKYVSGEVMTD
jgi:hypothetical protein